mgnify:CR=1 FL=1
MGYKEEGKIKSFIHEMERLDSQAKIQDKIARAIFEATRNVASQDEFEEAAKAAMDYVMGNWGPDGTCFYQP